LAPFLGRLNRRPSLHDRTPIWSRDTPSKCSANRGSRLEPLTAVLAIHDFLARIDGAGLPLDTVTVAEVDDVLAGSSSKACTRVPPFERIPILRVFFR